MDRGHCLYVGGLCAAGGATTVCHTSKEDCLFTHKAMLIWYLSCFTHTESVNQAELQPRTFGNLNSSWI